jgi:hypothetical protein
LANFSHKLCGKDYYKAPRGQTAKGNSLSGPPKPIWIHQVKNHPRLSAFEYIYQCQHSKQEIIILNLDFTKAFDTIEHPTIIAMMKQFGFNEDWIRWTSEIMSSTTTLVLLNGVPGKSIHCNRGGRQRDPMSPLLFVLAAELLQCIINKAHQQGLFQIPIPSRDVAGFPIIQYADDTIMIMKVSQRELLCLKDLLESYGQSTGLMINYAKSCLVPLNISEEKAELLAGVFGCKIQGMPFTYLGLPMDTTKPRVEHYALLMNRAERQLTSVSSMLTHAGRFNSILSSLPTFTICSVQVPVAVHEYVEPGDIVCGQNQK